MIITKLWSVEKHSFSGNARARYYPFDDLMHPQALTEIAMIAG
jgi:hypothetical protein